MRSELTPRTLHATPSLSILLRVKSTRLSSAASARASSPTSAVSLSALTTLVWAPTAPAVQPVAHTRSMATSTSSLDCEQLSCCIGVATLVNLWRYEDPTPRKAHLHTHLPSSCVGASSLDFLLCFCPALYRKLQIPHIALSTAGVHRHLESVRFCILLYSVTCINPSACEQLAPAAAPLQGTLPRFGDWGMA